MKLGRSVILLKATFNMVDARVSVQGDYVIHTNILLKLMQLASGVLWDIQ